MSLERVGVFVTVLLMVAVVVLSFISYVQLSEIRQMREDMAALQQSAEEENQDLRDELASLRADLAGLDTSEDLATIQQSISRLRLQNLGVWVDDERLVSLQIPQITQPGMSVLNMESLQSDYDSWWERYPETVRTIRRSSYGAEWPFPTNEAILGCHGDEVMAIVNGNEFMLDSDSPSLHFFLDDIATISVFDPSSPELAAARKRMIDEALGLCHGKVVR